jgi:hypothetical protein
MRFLISIILTALLSFFSGLWFPWWGIAIVAFAVATAIPQSSSKAFVSGFLALFILWGGLAWCINIQNQGILSRKIALILPLSGSSFLLILVTALLGALVAGSAALSGSLLRQAN